MSMSAHAPGAASETTTLTWLRARRIALRAQGMGGTRRRDEPTAATSRRALARTLERTHLLQIDSVSVFARAHHLPVFTRTGRWDPSAIERSVRPGPRRTLREGLAHEAAYITPEIHRLLDFRRRAAAQKDWGVLRDIAATSPHLFPRIREAIAEIGPVSAAAVSQHLGDSERGSGWGWRRTDTQWAVEYLFRSGELDCVGRSSQFERLYALIDEHDPVAEAPPGARSDPAAVLVPAEGLDAAAGFRRTADGGPAMDQDASVRELVARAARSLGIAETGSLADYFRLRIRDVAPAVRELIAEGELREVAVSHPTGARTMLLHREAPAPTPLSVAALVSPFDPIVFHRPRLSHLFDVEYRIGIYTPAEQRTTGYYSLLFLLGDLFPARVDLRADRARGVLQVRGAFREPLPHVPDRQRPNDRDVISALAEELRLAARWQGLAELEVLTGAGTGDLSAALAASVHG